MGQVSFKTQDELAAERLISWREGAEVSAFQAEQALADFGHLARVETLMNDPATSEKTRRAWSKAQVCRRMSPTVLEMATALGLTEAQLDALFEHAGTIEA